MTTIEEATPDECRDDCYICHPGVPLPWWAFQQRRFQVMNRLTVALNWFEQAKTGTTEEFWQRLSMAEKAIRDAYNLMREKQ